MVFARENVIGHGSCRVRKYDWDDEMTRWEVGSGIGLILEKEGGGVRILMFDGRRLIGRTDVVLVP